MADRVIKTKDLSKKDIQVSGGLIRIKNGSYNIRSNNGANSLAPFNESNPLANWTAPTGAKTGAIAHVLFTNGLAYFTYNGTLWILDWFYASNSFIYSYPYSTLVLRFDVTGMDPEVTSVEVLVNTTGTEWSLTSAGPGMYAVLEPTDLSFNSNHYLDNGYKKFYLIDGEGPPGDMDVTLDVITKEMKWNDIAGVTTGNSYVVSFIFIKGE